MKCDKCNIEFLEKEIHEHHIHPRFMCNKKGDGKKIYLCEKCHNILHLIIPSVLWKYIENKKGAINSVIKFTEDYVKEDGDKRTS